jgi:hypothetical protein
MCSLLSLWCCPEIIPVLRAALKTFSRYSSLIVSFRPSPLPHPLTLDGWAGGNMHWTGNRYCGGHLNRFFYVLVPVSQEDWVRKASFIFSPVYAADLAKLRTQNRFRNHDLDELQYQLGFTDKVRS